MDKTRIGVLIGTGMGGLTAFSSGVEALIQKGYKKITPFFIPYSITNMGSALLAIDTRSNGTKLLYFDSVCYSKLLLLLRGKPH